MPLENFQANIDTKLEGIHNNVISRLKLKSKAKADAAKAKKIEEALNRIKKMDWDADPKNPLDMKMIEASKVIIADAFETLNENRQSKLTGEKGTGNPTVFNREHATYKSILDAVTQEKIGSKKTSGIATSYGADDIFEEEFAAVLKSIAFHAKGVNLEMGQLLAGRKPANVNWDKDLTEYAADAVALMADKTSKTLQEDMNTAGNKPYGGPVARPQKVDVNGLSIDQPFESQIDQVWIDLYNLFAGCTFSLKNYSSFAQGKQREDLDIHFGNTDFFKAIYGSMSAAHYGQKYIEKVFYSGLNAYKQGDTNVADHFYHLKFIYELTGVGLYSEDGTALSGVDFIIYNDPSKNGNIYVRSTAELICNQLETKNISKQFTGGVNISRTNFLKSLK